MEEEAVPRRINYLRMSITDRCNLRCFYCTYWQDWEKLPSREILSYEELLRVAGIGAASWAYARFGSPAASPWCAGE